MSSNDLVELSKEYARLCSGKEEYMICAKDANRQHDISYSYTQADIAFRNMHSDNFKIIDARLHYQDSLKPKVNPYTMGGLASGIAGPGAGLYAANETAKNNAAKDEARSYYKNEIDNAEENALRSSCALSVCLTDLNKKIKQLPNVDLAEKDIEYRKNLENEYKTAVQADVGIGTCDINKKLLGKIIPAFFFFGIISILFFAIDVSFLGVLFATLAVIFAVWIFYVLHEITEIQRNKDLTEIAKKRPEFEHALDEYKEARKTKSYSQDGTSICDTIIHKKM